MRLGEGSWLVAVACVMAGCHEPTVPIRTRAYGFDDLSTGDVFHWPAARLPVRFYGDPRGAMRSLVRDAVTAWETQFFYGEFSGVPVDDSLQADVIVAWAGSAPPDVAADTTAPAPACSGSTTNPAVVFKDSSANVLHVTVNVLAGYTDAQVAACVRRVVVHELGHALGLLQHSPNPDDVMNAPPTVYLPSPDDRRTVEVLYHTPATVFPPPR